MSWGDPPTRDFTEVKRDGTSVACTRKTDRLMLGDIPLERITYCFVDNKLDSVILKYFEGNKDEVSSVLREKLGRPLTGVETWITNHAIWLHVSPGVLIQRKKSEGEKQAIQQERELSRRRALNDF
jgi:hypothetical protein